MVSIRYWIPSNQELPAFAQSTSLTPFEAFQYAVKLTGGTASMTPGEGGVYWEASIPAENALNFCIAAANLHRFRVEE